MERLYCSNGWLDIDAQVTKDESSLRLVTLTRMNINVLVLLINCHVDCQSIYLEFLYSELPQNHSFFIRRTFTHINESGGSLFYRFRSYLATNLLQIEGITRK